MTSFRLATVAAIVAITITFSASAQAPNKVVALDGTWLFSFVCSQHKVDEEEVTMSAGRITGTMNTLQDSLELDASVSPSGKIEGFLTGSQTGGPLSGTVTDFTAGHASGSLKLVAFDSCSGNWQARRAN